MPPRAPLLPGLETGPQPPKQLALDLRLEPAFGRADFLEGASNRAALALIESWPDWPDRIVALVGPPGSGKSHLAAIFAERSGARRLSAAALTVEGVTTALATDIAVVEDLDPATFDPVALFHLINLARERGAFVVFTASRLPAGWLLDLSDLRSRLRAIPAVEIAPPDDALLRAVMLKLFADRQVTVDEALLSFLMVRTDRSFAGVRLLVDRLDREAMRLKRPLTRALAAQILREDDLWLPDDAEP
jgi:chromosomal replication initiation ATPase DnaA